MIPTTSCGAEGRRRYRDTPGTAEPYTGTSKASVINAYQRHCLRSDDKPAKNLPSLGLRQLQSFQLTHVNQNRFGKQLFLPPSRVSCRVCDSLKLIKTLSITTTEQRPALQGSDQDRGPYEEGTSLPAPPFHAQILATISRVVQHQFARINLSR